MSENTMTQFNTEGQPAFSVENKENENSPESSPENKDIDPTGSSDQDKDKKTEKENGGEENFADHPRWKEREDDWKNRFNDQEKRHVDDIAKLREDFVTKSNPLNKPNNEIDASVTVPSWFGGDESQWQEFQSWNELSVGKAKNEALKEIENKSAADQKAINDATTYFNEEVAIIETDKTINSEGIKIDRNKLLKFVLDNDLVDSKGRWNYKAAFMMMRGSLNSKSDLKNDRKNFAGATTSEKGGETKPPTYTTSEDFSKPGSKPW